MQPGGAKNIHPRAMKLPADPSAGRPEAPYPGPDDAFRACPAAFGGEPVRTKPRRFLNVRHGSRPVNILCAGAPHLFAAANAPGRTLHPSPAGLNITDRLDQLTHARYTRLAGPSHHAHCAVPTSGCLDNHSRGKTHGTL